ncbi:MAG: GNAT family N-acetyltransferase [Bacteroidota bacterium]|nr:GNAT family N-acetyltransferase [Bacteroidota bacterium]
MNFPAQLATQRLLIKPLNINDDEFILELLNTAGWIKFIGNRNITSLAEAKAYIQKILDNENIFYWAVQLKGHDENIGIVTFIKRDYLEHHDIGFAFLPRYFNQGYAYEATMVVLYEIISDINLSHILATTVPENITSIKLLQKMGLGFEKEIEVDKERLHVYGTSTDKLKEPGYYAKM